MNTEVKYGLILGLGICLYTVVAHLLGFYTTNIQTGKYGDIVISLLPIVVLFLAIREKRSRAGSLTIFQGVKTGLLVALISFPISTAFLWVYHHYINPNWLEFILAYERSTMAQAGKGAVEIATRLDALRAGNSDMAQLVGGLVGTIILGLVLSIVFSLILRRKQQPAHS
ncbi:MAG TPA: DUF4199 domain-containing protein [Pyrinomonadaceae bacterium]|nr:DUF4199 domain-containing protein [Pyrinomonadaceae bacterium]